MTRTTPSIDGFVPRRPNTAQDGRQIGMATPQPLGQGLRTQAFQPKSAAESVGAAAGSRGLTRSEIDESLRGIDTDASKGAVARPKRGFTKNRARRVVKWLIILFILTVVGIIGWIGYRTIIAGGNVFKGNLLGLIQSKPLQQDANGRSNILILGTSEDDPGHPGGYLTDSMMVMSIDQKNKAVDMFSIPRDLYVKYGISCDSGNAGKINAYFSCVNPDMTSASAEQERLTKTRQFVGKIFGLDIQYAVHVNNTVVKEAVDAVGGVDVNIQGNGPVPYGVQPGSVLDRNFDWRCNYKCYLVKYSPGVHHLDGTHALFLSQARGDVAPTYGFVNSNFDREANQRKIILALKQKAISTGTLTDVSKVTKLIDALGKNLRTNFDTSEIRTLMQLGTDIPPQNIQQLSLYDGSNAVVTTANIGGASSVVPSAGTFDYSGIRAFIKQKLSTDPVTRENAQVDVLNGSKTPGIAQTEADKLSSAGFIVGIVGNAPKGPYQTTEIYQIGRGNEATKAKLESIFGVKVRTDTPPTTVTGNTKFVVILAQPSPSN